MSILEETLLQTLPEFLTRESTLCILRIIVGVVLALLTVYRREMSCNRVYSGEEDAPGPASRGHLRGRRASRTGDQHFTDHGRVERKRSSSALPSTTVRRRHTIGSRNVAAGGEFVGTETDPTDELLEAAGRFCSGGPLLAMSLAVLDHLVFTSFLSSLILSSKTSVQDDGDDEHFQFLDDDERSRRKNTVENKPRRRDVRVYNVAWDAATNYFESIAKKFEHGGEIPDSDESTPLPSRSKSTSNLDVLDNSTETSRCVHRGIMALARRRRKIAADITLLPADAQISIFSYLPPQDLLSFTCTCHSARRLLDDGSDVTERKSSRRGSLDGNHVNNEATLIWKTLFARDFSWVISEWSIGQEAFMRSMSSYRNQQLLGQGNTVNYTANEEINRRGRVLHHLLPLLLNHNQIYTATTTQDDSANGNNDANEPVTPITPPASMKEFYFTFAETWLEYTIAGCNRSDKCLIGLHGHAFDISNFVEQHPGSTETLLLQAGRDATVFFESMGHSLGARKLASGMCSVINRETIHWEPLDGSKSSILHSSWGLIPPSSRELRNNKNKVTPGFLIPRKRSRPRRQGGLHNTRKRLMKERALEFDKASRWGLSELGPHGMFGGVQVYYDPFCSCWKWWYTDLEFHPVYVDSVDPDD